MKPIVVRIIVAALIAMVAWGSALVAVLAVALTLLGYVDHLELTASQLDLTPEVKLAIAVEIGILAFVLAFPIFVLPLLLKAGATAIASWIVLTNGPALISSWRR